MSSGAASNDGLLATGYNRLWCYSKSFKTFKETACQIVNLQDVDVLDNKYGKAFGYQFNLTMADGRGIQNVVQSWYAPNFTGSGPSTILTTRWQTDLSDVQGRIEDTSGNLYSQPVIPTVDLFAAGSGIIFGVSVDQALKTMLMTMAFTKGPDDFIQGSPFSRPLVPGYYGDILAAQIVVTGYAEGSFATFKTGKFGVHISDEGMDDITWDGVNWPAQRFVSPVINNVGCFQTLENANLIHDVDTAQTGAGQFVHTAHL